MEEYKKITLSDRLLAKKGGVIFIPGHRGYATSCDVEIYRYYEAFTTPSLLNEIKRIGFFAFAYSETRNDTGERVYCLVISQTPSLDIFLNRKCENEVVIPSTQHKSPLPHNNERYACVYFFDDHYIVSDINRNEIRVGKEDEFKCCFMDFGKQSVYISDTRGIDALVSHLHRFPDAKH